MVDSLLIFKLSVSVCSKFLQIFYISFILPAKSLWNIASIRYIIHLQSVCAAGCSRGHYSTFPQDSYSSFPLSMYTPLPTTHPPSLFQAQQHHHALCSHFLTDQPLNCITQHHQLCLHKSMNNAWELRCKNSHENVRTQLRDFSS